LTKVSKDRVKHNGRAITMGESLGRIKGQIGAVKHINNLIPHT